MKRLTMIRLKIIILNVHIKMTEKETEIRGKKYENAMNEISAKKSKFCEYSITNLI